MYLNKLSDKVEHKIKMNCKIKPLEKSAYTCKTNQVEWVGFMFNKKRIFSSLILHLFYYGLLEKIIFFSFQSGFVQKKKRWFNIKKN